MDAVPAERADSLLPAAVLFDMDGTLIDSEGLWLEAEHAVMSQLGGRWTDADQSHCLGGPLERVADYMIDLSGSSASTADVGRMLLDTMEERLHSSPLAWRPGARALVLECRERGIPTALVSASWNRLIDAVGHKIETDLRRPAFDVTVAGDDVARGKPHPEPYLTAAASLGHPPAECLALEDSPTGVRSAVAAGCRVVAIPHLASVTGHGAAVVTTLEGWSLTELWVHAQADS
jgi:HAD superfamily hydrolase (TIGR01509 family)